MTPKEIQKHFENATTFYSADSSYAVVPTKWLFNSFRSWFRSETNRLDIFHSPATDCDDFAALYRVLAGIHHAQCFEREEEGVAVGEFHYERIRPAGKHAIVCAFTDEGLVYVEPQSCFQIHPTEDELHSQSFVRF